MTNQTLSDQCITDAVATLFARKVILLTEVIDGQLADKIKDAATIVYAERELLALHKRLPQDLQARYARRTILMSEFASGAQWVERIRTHPVIASIANLYLSESHQPMRDSFVRSISPGSAENHLPYHQDQTISGHKLLNIWVALSACGRDAPALEFVLGNDEVLSAAGDPTHGVAVERARLDESYIRARFPTEAFWRPVFQPGDAAVFLGTTVHRTWSPAGATLSRMSIELRLA